jgi:hypothetical protein
MPKSCSIPTSLLPTEWAAAVQEGRVGRRRAAEAEASLREEEQEVEEG